MSDCELSATKKFVKFPSINQYINVSNNLKKWSERFDSDIEKITINGTVKVHGCNMGIGYWCDDTVTLQSRNINITETGIDQFSFGDYVSKLGGDDFIKDLLKPHINDAKAVFIFGEFFGKGIQKFVAVNEIERSYMVFDIVRVYSGKDEDDKTINTWDFEQLSLSDIPSFPELNFYRSIDFQQFDYDIDIYDNRTNKELIDFTIENVENKCPVATSIKSESELECKIGEGIVWKGIAKLTNGMEKKFIFKTKGDEHKRGQGTIKPTKKSKFTPEQIEAIDKFYEIALTNDRLEQGIEVLKESTGGNDLEIKQIGEYIKWVIHDIKKEHEHDFEEIVKPYGIVWKDLNKVINQDTRNYFIDKLK